MLLTTDPPRLKPKLLHLNVYESALNCWYSQTETSLQAHLNSVTGYLGELEFFDLPNTKAEILRLSLLTVEHQPVVIDCFWPSAFGNDILSAIARMPISKLVKPVTIQCDRSYNTFRAVLLDGKEILPSVWGEGTKWRNVRLKATQALS